MFWVLAPRNSASVVFTQFTDSGGWSSMGLALMVGQISAIYACICSDAAAHMSEEIKVRVIDDILPDRYAFADHIHQDAGRTVPTAMIGSYLLSGVLSVIFLVSYLFVLIDVDGAVNHPTGYPFLFVFEHAFSMEAVNALTAIVICLIFAGTLSYNLSSSRQMWAVSYEIPGYIEIVLTVVPVCPRRRTPLFQLDRKSRPLAGSPSQCRPPDCRTHHSLVSDQHRFRRCIVSAQPPNSTTHKNQSLTAEPQQRNHLPQPRMPHVDLHGLGRLRPVPPHLLPRATTEMPVESGQMGSCSQRRRFPVLVFRFLLVFLAE
jgi:hypothetical protein